MLEMGTSGLMSGEGKRVGYQSVPITRPSSTLPDFRPYIHAAFSLAPIFRVDQVSAMAGATVERNGARLAVMLHPLLPRRPATATHDGQSAFAGVLNQWTHHRYHGSSNSPRTQRCVRRRPVSQEGEGLKKEKA